MAAPTRFDRLIRYVLLASGAAVLLLAALVMWADGQQASPPDTTVALQPAQVAAKAEFVGADKCEACHQAPTATYLKAGVTKFVALTESRTRREQDHHALAFERIDPANNPRAKRMCEELGIADISQEQRCLSCHADWRYEQETKTWAERPATYKLGVTCEACHGPASQWFLPHTDAKWRAKTPAEKERLGMSDVRDPQVSARKCLSCHIGNAAEGKFITHEMYVAGHPPLPSFELTTFADAMPRHWRQLDEKEDFVLREAFVKANPAVAKGARLHRSRGTLSGGLAAMQQSLELSRGVLADGKVDLAVFDCYACHHELKTPAWRQERQDAGRPRGLRPAVWPEALVEAAQAFNKEQPAMARETWRSALAKYHAAFDARALGDTAQLQQAEEGLRRVLEEAGQTLVTREQSQAALLRALTTLCAASERQTIDFDVAQQIARSAKVLFGDLVEKRDEAAVAVVFEKWRTSLVLEVPDRKTAKNLDPAERLKAVEAFDPRAFREDLRRLQELVASQ